MTMACSWGVVTSSTGPVKSSPRTSSAVTLHNRRKSLLVTSNTNKVHDQWTKRFNEINSTIYSHTGDTVISNLVETRAILVSVVQTLTNPPVTNCTGDPLLLTRENDTLTEELTCKVCFAHEANIIFLPCSHLTCCETCADQMSDCPICRVPKDSAVQTRSY